MLIDILAGHQYDAADSVVGTEGTCERLKDRLVNRCIRVSHANSRRNRRFIALHPSSLFKDALILTDRQPVVDIGPDSFERIVIAWISDIERTYLVGIGYVIGILVLLTALDKMVEAVGEFSGRERAPSVVGTFPAKVRIVAAEPCWLSIAHAFDNPHLREPKQVLASRFGRTLGPLRGFCHGRWITKREHGVVDAFFDRFILIPVLALLLDGVYR